ncbi:MAG: ribosome-associated translation inhibitor RaiA [Chitinophagales bacterium]|nr:ribosome-associated translation inhibitor RaiA [Chitinophagales bacterium]
MNVLIHAHEFSASEQLSDFIHQKAAKLQQWFDHIVDVEIYLSLDHKSGQVRDKIAKIKVNVPGHQAIAGETRLHFEDAIEAAMDMIKKQLVRHKEKMRGQ